MRQTYQQQLAQYERQANGALDDAQRTELKRHVLDDYVNSEALVTRADELGYRVSDGELLDAMAQVPAFQVDGKFDKAHAVAVLKAQGRLGRGDRGAVPARRRSCASSTSALSESSFVTPTEFKQLRALTRQQRELAWLTVSAAKYAADATPDEAALKTYYEAHKSEYMTPETVNLRYVEISLAELAKQGERR